MYRVCRFLSPVGNLAAGGDGNTLHAMAQDFAYGFYHSTAWLKCRAAFISARGGLCERCYAKGLIVPGDTVHHIIPLTPENISDPSVTLSFDNLRLVCRDCHAAEHHPDGLRYSFGPDGTILPDSPVINL